MRSRSHALLLSCSTVICFVIASVQIQQTLNDATLPKKCRDSTRRGLFYVVKPRFICQRASVHLFGMKTYRTFPPPRYFDPSSSSICIRRPWVTNPNLEKKTKRPYMQRHQVAKSRMSLVALDNATQLFGSLPSAVQALFRDSRGLFFFHMLARRCMYLKT